MKGKKLFLEGIVIHSFDYGESHKILRVFTKSNGIISLMVYGARTYKSKFRGNVELLNHIELSAHFSGRSKMLVLEELNLLKSFASSFDYEKVWTVFPFLKFLSLFHFESEEENEKIFLMLIKLLDTLKDSNSTRHLKLLVFAFVLKSLSVTSMMGDLRVCNSCFSTHHHKVFEKKDDILFFCENCSNNEEEYKSYSWKFFNFLLKIIYSRFDEMIYFIIDNNTLDKVRGFVNKVCIQTLGRKWNDFELHENPFNLES